MRIELLNLERNHSRIKSNVFSLLSAPVTEADIRRFIAEKYGAEVYIPHELLDLYNWHNGTDVSGLPPEEFKQGYLAYELFFNRLNDVSQIIIDDHFYRFRDKKLFPVFSSLNGEYFSILLKEDSQVYYCQTFDEEIPFVSSIFDSLTSLFKTINELYDIGYYYLSPELNIIDENLDEHYPKYLEIGKRNNPKSKYWPIKIAKENE